MKKILISLLILTSLSIADTFEIKPYNSNSDFSKNNIENTNQEYNPGISIDAYPENLDGFGFTVAYEGDFMILNDYIPNDKQIQENNYFIGVGYKF